MTSLAPLAIAGPFLVAALLGASLPMDRRSDDLIGVVTASAAVIFAAFLLADAAGGAGPRVEWLGGWEPRDGTALGVSLAYDPFGAGLTLLAAVLVLGAFVFAWRYFEAKGPIFHALMLVFMAAMAGFSLTGDLFTLFVFFELMSVSAYALTAYRIEESGPLQGALTFAVTNTVGAALILTGIGMLYGRTGALNMAQVGEALAGHKADGLVLCSFALIVGGFLVKAAIVPFHFWLADAYAVAPTPVAVVFSGLMSDLGIYAAARIYWTVFDGALGEHEAGIRAIFVGLGVLTTLVGALMCLVQSHLKRLLAFVTISQVGLALIGVGLLTPDGLAAAALLIPADGLLRAGLFIALGAVLHRCGSVNEFKLQGAGRILPWPLRWIFVAGALGLAALPPLGAFAGKGALERALEHQGYGWVVPIVVFTTVLTAGALLRAGGRIFLGWGGPPSREALAAMPQDEEETTGPRGRTPPGMIGAAGVLTLLGLALSAVPGLLAHAQDVAIRFTDRAGYAAKVLHGVDQPLAAVHFEGTRAIDVLLGLLTAAGAAALAYAVLNRRRVRMVLPSGVRAPVVDGLLALRRLHSGQVGDYIAWLTVGMAALGGLLALVAGGG